MIPKKIHYCWFGGKALPLEIKKCIKSWEKYCPEYEIIRWDESNFDIKCNKFVQEAYKQKAWAFVSDYARLQIVYNEGGIYLDTDVELLKNLDFLLDNKCYVAMQSANMQCNTGLGFGAEPNSPVILKMMTEYENITFMKERMAEIACPVLNTKVLLKLGYVHSDEIVKFPEVTVFPPRYFDPYGEDKNLVCKDTVSIHHYSATWLDWKTILKRKIIRVIGQERTLKLKKVLKFNR